ncbi:MAG: hypothetical protein JST96_12425 [Bacteroidetes bacterium]|nr:hypothetical protein [Bacteroidota bacterium]
MKRSFTTITFIVLAAALHAQGVFSNKTNATLEKVIQDYPNRFKNIKGEVIIENPQTTEYRSKVEVPGSTSCTVTRYSSKKDDVYSWTCIVFEGDNFDQVSNKFKETFNQIKNTIIKVEGQKPFILNGQYETPSEEKKFTTVIFELLPAVGEMKKVKVDLSLEYEMTGWKVSLSVYDRDRKDDEQGTITGR